jgi:nucleotide-binding universal stress UspA family protein
MSLSEYLLQEVRKLAERPTVDELRQRLRQRRPVQRVIDALKDRDADLDVCLSRKPTLGLATQRETNVTDLDDGQLNSALD